jgi:hypothetical protein
MSAFENYAKAKLLKRRYMVFRITKPKKLGHLQKSKPISFRTLNSIKYRDEYLLSHKTIGLETLLSDKYFEFLKLSEEEKFTLDRCRKYRNKIHFQGPSFSTIEEEFLRGVLALKNRICT